MASGGRGFYASLYTEVVKIADGLDAAGPWQDIDK